MVATSPLSRARAYIAKMPDAVSGAGGHNQTFAVACQLVRFGLSQSDAWTLLCEYNQRCQPPWNERELRHKLNDAFRRITGQMRPAATAPRQPVQKIDPATATENFLKGFRCSAGKLIGACTCRIPPLICGQHFHRQGAYLIDQLFEPSELLNIVSNSVVENDKARPDGIGLTLPRNEWEERLLNPVAWQAGGAWVRMNPLDGKGVADANVTAFRFALIEFDDIPVELQLSLLAKLPLPIAAIISSGGRSVHAWVRVDCKDAADYLRTVSQMLTILARFGVDTQNKNPSRLSRLPGVVRSIGATGDGRQQLYYLNPNPEQKPIL